MKDILKNAVQTFPPMPHSVQEFNKYLRENGTYIPTNLMLEVVKNNEHDKKILLESVQSPLYNFDPTVSLERIFSLLGSNGVKNILVAEFIKDNFKFDILPRDKQGNKKSNQLKCICDLSPYGLDSEVFLKECQKETFFISSWILEEDKKLHILLPSLMLLRLGIIIFSQVLIMNDLARSFNNKLTHNFNHILELEKEFLGCDHIEFLEFLLTLWNSDPFLIESVRHLKKPHLAPSQFKKSAYIYAIVEKIFTPHNKVSQENILSVLDLMQKIRSDGVKFDIDLFKSKITKEYVHIIL